MSVDPNHLREASRRLSLLRGEKQARFAAYQAQCREKVPELGRLDGAIAQAVSRAVAAALQHSQDPGPAVEEARRDSLALQARRREVLREAGIDPQSLEEAPYCSKCGDTGRQGRELCSCLLELCAQENRRELAQKLDLDSLRFENFSMVWYSQCSDPEQGLSPRECMEMVYRLCVEYARDFPRHPYRNLFLYGGTGLGKTFLSGCIAGAVCEKGRWTVYETAGELFRRYESAKFVREPESERAVWGYENCDLLIMDDLGSEMNTAFVQSALYQVLNQRMLSGRHTVISSNLTMDAVRERYTPQIASRLEGEFRGLPFIGEDIRLQKKRS